MALKYTSIYDVIRLEWDNYYNGEHKLNDKKSLLYDHIAKLLGIFALCDFRHDFQQGANIFLKVKDGVSGTVVQLFCKPVAAAFYKVGSKRYSDLYNYLFDKLKNNITSNNAAITFFKSQMDNFFLNTYIPYKSLFIDKAYMRYYDMCAGEPKEYTDSSDLVEFRKKLSPESTRTNQVFYIDSQKGNPLDKLFNGAPGPRAKYFYNFATAMDAAPKSAGDVHTYMDLFVQFNDPKPSIHRAFTTFNGSVNINSFRLIDGQWTTSVSVNYEDTTYSMDFSLRNQASVNNLGLAIVRGRKSEEISKKPKKIDGDTLNEILVNHLFKSLGDRLQDYSMSDAGKAIQYKSLSNIRDSTYRDPKLTTDGKHIIVFTNDELNNYQLYMMGINTVFTGTNIVTAYINKEAGEVTVNDVRNFFKERNRTLHSLLSDAKQPLIVINNIETIQATIYEAFVRSATNAYINAIPLLRKIKDGDELTEEYLSSLIKGDNLPIFRHLMTDNLLEYLRTYTMPKEVSQTFIRSEFRRFDTEARDINASINSATLSGETIKNIFNRITLLVESFVSILQKLRIPITNSFIIAHTLMANQYRNIKSLLYKNGKLIDELSNSTGRSITIYKDKLASIGYDIKEYSDIIVRGILLMDISGTVREAIDNGIANITSQIKELEPNEIYDGIVQMSEYYISLLLIRIVSKKEYSMIMGEMFGISKISIAIADKSTLKDLIAEAGPPQIKEFLKEKPTTTNKKKSLISKLRKVGKIQSGTRKVSTKAATKGATKASAKSKATTAANSKKASVKRYEKLKKSTKETRLQRVRQQANVGSRLSPAIGSTSFEDQEILAVGISEEPDSFVVVSPMSVLFNIGRAFVNLLNPFTGGGTKTRERESKLIQLCNSKLDFMAHAVSREPEYAAVLVAADRILSLIVDDYERISRSKTRPVVLRSSLSIIREDDEEEDTQVGGGTHTMTMTMQKSVEPSIVGPYSSIEIAAEKAAPQQTLPSGTKVTTISRASAKSLLEQRLAAFLWFGFSRDAEAESIESEVFKPLLPELVDSIAGDAHNVLFWQLLREVGDRPYDFYESLYKDALHRYFDHSSGIKIKITEKARNLIRNVLSKTTRKVQSPPKEDITKSSSTQNSEATKRKLQSNAITRRWAQAK